MASASDFTTPNPTVPLPLPPPFGSCPRWPFSGIANPPPPGFCHILQVPRAGLFLSEIAAEPRPGGPGDARRRDDVALHGAAARGVPPGAPRHVDRSGACAES